MPRSRVSFSLALLLACAAIYLLSIPSPAAPSPPSQTSVPVTLAPLEAHLIQFGAFSSAESARIEAARYVSRGAAGYVFSGSLNRVIASACPDRDSAESVAYQISRDEGIDACVYSVSSNEITVLSETPDALLAVDKSLREACLNLSETARGLDSSALSPDDARARLAIISANLASGAGSLTPESPLDAILSNLSRALADISGKKTLTGLLLSSQIKYNYIEAKLEHIAWLKNAV